MEHFLHFLKILKLRHFLKVHRFMHHDLTLIQHEKSVRNACRQMQIVLDSNLRAVFMFELISKSYPFLEKLIFFTKKMTYGLGQDISCSQ